MSKRFLFVSVVALVLFAPMGASAQAGARAGAKAAPAKPGTDETAKAKQIYSIDCALCHGATGDGKTDLAKDMQLTLIDWTDPKSLAGMSDQDLFKIIRNGKDKMPPEDAGRAKDNEVQALVVYIRTFSKNGPAPAAAPAAAPGRPGACASPGAQAKPIARLHGHLPIGVVIVAPHASGLRSRAWREKSQRCPSKSSAAY